MIRHKLIGGGIAISGALLLILGGLLIFFSELESGFGNVVSKVTHASNLSKQSTEELGHVKTELNEDSHDLSLLADSIKRTNQFLSITERKIEGLSERLSDLNEVVEEMYDELPEGDIQDSVEEIADEVSDLQDATKKEALIGLQKTVAEMEGFQQTTAKISQELQQTNEKLFETAKLSNEVIEGNTQVLQISQEFEALFQELKLIFIAVVLGVTALISIAALLLTRSITEPLQQSVNFMDRLAEGDFSDRLVVRRQDEIGIMASSLNSAIDKLCEVFRSATDTSNSVSDQSHHIRQSSEKLSNEATESAAAVEEISASMVSVTQQSKNNADSASNASNLAQQSRSEMNRNNEYMKEMLGAMDTIIESSQNAARIIKIIDEIAFQTNLLALNAAVEAARAGQHGKGFSVVAQEVRNLAQRSANAAKETTDTINDIIEQTNKGHSITEKTYDSLQSSASSIAEIAENLLNIQNATKEQVVSAEQIDIGLQQVSQSVQENSRIAEESFAVTRQLVDQADHLTSQIGYFRLSPVSPDVNDDDVQGDDVPLEQLPDPNEVQI